jgi:mRNA interferase RelE/StbE
LTKEILLSPRAQKEFLRLDSTTRDRIRRALSAYAENGIGDVKRLKGTRDREDLLRLRVGDFRIVFADIENQVRVTRVIRRGEGYEWL